MIISYTFGMVDLLHFGHMNIIKRAAEESDLCIFGMVSDKASDNWYGTHISNETERRIVLEGIKYIDEVWVQNTFDPLENLRKLHSLYPGAIIRLYSGNEWGIISAKRYVESIGGSVEKIDYYEKLSPSEILNALNNDTLKSSKASSSIISTKANTLQSLKEVLKKSYVEDLLIITVGNYKSEQQQTINSIVNRFKDNQIVVRSSSMREDAFEESNAGHFASVLNVHANDVSALRRAIETVIHSYGKDVAEEEQVLIQLQTHDVKMSGVVFTRDIQRNRPYYVVNYSTDGRTDAVTSGISGKTVWISKDISRNNVPRKWKELLESVWELEELLPGILLDIEFGITNSQVVIFQVRPLAAAYKFSRIVDDRIIKKAKNDSQREYTELSLRKMKLFSDMAFWNPAEMIGVNPKSLDYSLYREIITQSAWNEGLIRLGYRYVPGELMFKFGNKPYISIEKAFFALLPGSISEELANKLVSYYVSKFKKDISSHDKIEFEISNNCFDFSLEKKIKELPNKMISRREKEEFYDALLSQTIRVIENYSSIMSEDISSLKKLECTRIDIQNITEGCNDVEVLSKSIRVLRDAIVKYGTPQFALHARCAFISKSLCNSLVEEGYVSANDLNEFLSNINTVAFEYEKDYEKVLCNRMEKEIFLNKYGHLRAGTYNIRSSRYDQNPKFFESVSVKKEDIIEESSYDDSNIRQALREALDDYSLTGINENTVNDFIKSSVKNREYFKFVFTKSLSCILELIKKMGSVMSISEKDLSYLEFPEITLAEHYPRKERLRELWSLIISQRKKTYRVNSDLILPEVICSVSDFDCVESVESRPNFISENSVEGEVIGIDDLMINDLDGKIVVIEKADPGYDWIFSKGICGLITKYGGAASHMAIRCAEFKIPAAIGCGEKLFTYVSESNKIRLDCKHEEIKRIDK